MEEDSKAPLVTGISPREGPPDTKVTLRGERLGENKNDVIGKQLRIQKVKLDIS